MTAELLARALRMDGPVEVYAEFGPDQPAEAALSLIAGQSRTVAAVGHEPMLSQLLRELCGEGAKIEKEKLAKGAIAALRLKPPEDGPGDLQGRARLKYMIDP